MKALLAALMTISLHAQELPFLEKFADPSTRKASLAELTPQTRDWFYYHALYYQMQGDENSFDETLQQWRQRSEVPIAPVSTNGLVTLQNRQMLLRSKTDPVGAAKEIATKLDLTFDYEKSSVVEARKSPSTLDAKMISADAYEAATLEKFPDEPWKHYSPVRLQTELQNTKNFSKEKSLSVLQSLSTANTPESLELIATCLEKFPEKSFGELPIHLTLVHSQLQTLLKRIPKLSYDWDFSSRYLQTLRPSDESHYLRDPQQYLAHLTACDGYLRNLPPLFNQWKADCLWQKLLLQQKQNILSRNDLLRYLALPIGGCQYLSLHDAIETGDLCFFAKSYFDVLGGDLTGNEADLESMLLFFLRDTKDAADFAKFIPKKPLAKLHAKAHLLQGEQDQMWMSAFTASELESLRTESQLSFAAEQVSRFSPKDEVTLLLDCKNTPKCTLRIFEIDLVHYLQSGLTEPDAAIQLDGLVPHFQRELTFAQDPMILHRESINVPELKGRGAWVVECISGGIASRALIRKGDIVPFVEQTNKGQLIRLFDENQQAITAFRVHTRQGILTSQADGTLLIPATIDPSLPQTAVIEMTPEKENQPTLATHLALASSQLEYKLFCGFHLDREQLIADQKATVFLHPQLLANGQICSLDIIKNASLTVTATLLSGATSDHVISQLNMQSQMTAEFTMPRDAVSILVRLNAEISRGDEQDPIKFVIRQSYQFNEALSSSSIYSSFFVQTKNGHRLEILGRNGEPAPHWQFPIICKHRHFDVPLTVMMQTDDAGAIDLGELTDIESVKIDSEKIVAYEYRPQALERISLPKVIHKSSDSIIRIPLAKNMDSQTKSLIETTENVAPDKQPASLPTRDHSDLLSIVDDVLVITHPPAGNFLLTIANQVINLRISPGKSTGKFIQSPERILQESSESTLQIASTKVEADQVTIQLKNANENTSVSLVASYFSPQNPLAQSCEGLPFLMPSTQKIGFRTSSFLVNRVLDDETRYVLDRRSTKTFPGNMLPKPGLLVHRQTDSSDYGAYSSLDAGLPGELKKGSAKDESDSGGLTQIPIEKNTNGQIYDFIAQSSQVFYRLKPNSAGAIVLPRSKIAEARFLTILATDGAHFHQSTCALDVVPLKKRPRQLTHPLDSSKHYIGMENAVILQKGESATINHMLNAQWKEYNTLDDVYRLFVSAPESSLNRFSFLSVWNNLTEDQKIENYQKYACHEFHVFLYRKDAAFFEKFVKPNLLQKRELTFIDHYLLGYDLSTYLIQKEWRKLNAAERALLCKALPAAAERIRQEMRYEQLQFIRPSADLSILFKKTLVGSQLTLTERADIAALEQLDDRGRLERTEIVNAKLDKIIIPLIDFEDTTVEEAVDFLRQRISENDINGGINIKIHTRPRMSGNDLDSPLEVSEGIGQLRIKELRLTNVPASTALKYICDSTRLKYRIDSDAVRIVSATEDSEDLVTRTFQVPPDFMGALDYNPASVNDPFSAPLSDKGTAGLKPRSSVQELLRNKGVPFPDSSSANYIPSTSTLVVRNTASNMDLIEQLTCAMQCATPAKSVSYDEASGLKRDSANAEYDVGSVASAVADPFGDAPATVGAPVPTDPFAAAGGQALRPRAAVVRTTTLSYQESNYWQNLRYSNGMENYPVITINRFWLDLAAWDGKGAFLSPHFNECMGSDNEMLMCLALLDLPFTNDAPASKVENESLTLTAKQAMMLFYLDTRESAKIVENSPILVRQIFYPEGSRYRQENGHDIENTIDDQSFLTGEAYGSALVIANPTGQGRQVHVLWQIPQGAIPLDGMPATNSVTLEIKPYGNEQINLAFYFPLAGEFSCYPFHVSENDSVLAFPKLEKLRVSNDRKEQEAASFEQIADHGSAEKLLEFLRTRSLFYYSRNLDLSEMCWRLKDKDFYEKVIRILDERLFFSPEVSSFAFYHNDTKEIRRYLENSSTVRSVGSSLDTPFLTVTATNDLAWFDQEFDPFINNRAHRIAKQHQFPLEDARLHYQKLLDVFCYKTELTDDDHLQLSYFLILQNRIEEALAHFEKIQANRIPQQLHYDYMHCYMLFFQERPAEAKAIALRYKDHPLLAWNKRFRAVIDQADEVKSLAAGALAPAVPNAQDANSYLTMQHKDDGKLWLTHSGIKEATIDLYQVDMELLFSANPFLDEKKVLHHAIRPNKTIKVALEGKESTVELPAGYSQGNVIASVNSGTQQILQSINSSKIASIVNKGAGEIQVVERLSNQVQSRTYVKIYARLEDGSEIFYKDGYTDLRGKFDYNSHNNVDPQTVTKFAVFINHATLGTRLEMIDP